MLSQNFILVDTFLTKMSMVDFQKVMDIAAEKNGIRKFNVKNTEEGDGQKHDLTPELHYVTIRDLGKSNKEIDVVLKKASENSTTVGKRFPVNQLLENECHFHDQVWTSFQEFQNEVSDKMIFDKIPICFATDTRSKYKKIVLEYLKGKGFEVFPKGMSFDTKHLDYILEQYGKFHAVSLAFKKHRPKAYLELSKKFYDYLSQLSKMDFVKESMEHIMEECMKNLKDQGEDEIIKDFGEYAKNPSKVHVDVANYKGKHGVIIHGDCWNNNMMFKYTGSGESKEIADMRFFNFLSSREGTPVYDLSYCLYSGGTEEIFGNLEEHLRVYHKSLSEALKDLNCEAEELYSFDTLKQEWQDYSKFGFIMSLLVMRRQLVLPGKDMTLTEMIDHPQRSRDYYDKTQYKKRSLALIRHMHRNNYL